MRHKINRALPNGMELSQFMLLNYLATISEERRPSQLAKLFQLTRGAMTNTLGKLEAAGYIHMRPDWDDARRKCVVISSSRRKVRDEGLKKINPLIEEMVEVVGVEKLRDVLPIIRDLRNTLKN
jgi:DNA-binding MarR family transcriptional regulator